MGKLKTLLGCQACLKSRERDLLRQEYSEEHRGPDLIISMIIILQQRMQDSAHGNCIPAVQCVLFQYLKRAPTPTSLWIFMAAR